MNRLLIFFSLLLFLSAASKAQTDTTIMMTDLVVHGNRFSMPISEASRNTQIITAKEIKRSPIQCIPEILLYAPGVDIRQRGPMNVQSDISIHGGTFEQTLVMVNGVKLNDPQTGHHLMNIPVPIDNLQQVEILKGPGARIYGQNAFAGAINFITKAPENRYIGFRGYGGSFGSYGGALTVSLPIGNYKQYVTFSGDESDGYRYNTDYSIRNIFYQSELKDKHGIYELLLGMTQRKFGANGFYASPKFTNQYEEVRTGLTSISYETEIKNFVIKPQISWRWNEDNYLFVRQDPSIYQNVHNTNTIGAEINSSYRSKLGVTGIGFEFRKETINGDWVRGGTESKSNLDGFDRDNFGIYLDQLFEIGKKFDMTAGIYVNWYSDFDWNAFPGLDAGYNLTDKIRIYGNVGSTYRIPTFYDQYYSSPVEEGNPDLEPEEALTYEFGFKYKSGGVSFEGNYFVRDASRLIDWVLSPVDSVWRSQNYQNITTNGLGLSLSFDFREMIDDDFPVYNAGVNYNYLNQNFNEQEPLTSRYALENLKTQLIIGVDHKIIWKIKNSLKVRYIERIEEDPYWLIDDRIFYEDQRGLMIFLEATNLTNQEYSQIMTPMPGLWVRAGLNFQVGF